MEILRNLVGVVSSLPLYVRVKLRKLQQENDKGLHCSSISWQEKFRIVKYSSLAVINSFKLICFLTCFSLHLEFDCDIEKANGKCCHFIFLQKRSKAVAQKAGFFYHLCDKNSDFWDLEYF